MNDVKYTIAGFIIVLTIVIIIGVGVMTLLSIGHDEVLEVPDRLEYSNSSSEAEEFIDDAFSIFTSTWLKCQDIESRSDIAKFEVYLADNEEELRYMMKNFPSKIEEYFVLGVFDNNKQLAQEGLLVTEAFKRMSNCLVDIDLRYNQ